MKNNQKSLNYLQRFDISRNRLYEYAKKNFDEFVYKHNKIIEDGIKKQNIKFSKVICYDEQYVLENGV